MEENKARVTDDGFKDTKPKQNNGLPRQYSNPKANLTTASLYEDMVEECLQQDLGLEDEDAEEFLLQQTVSKRLKCQCLVIRWAAA